MPFKIKFRKGKRSLVTESRGKGCKGTQGNFMVLGDEYVSHLIVVWSHWYVHVKTHQMVCFKYVAHYISAINLFLTNVEFDPKVYWNIFLSAYLSRRANWRAVVRPGE